MMNSYRPAPPPQQMTMSMRGGSGRSQRKHQKAAQAAAAQAQAQAQAQAHQQQQAQAQAQAHMDKRYVRRPIERNIPPKIEVLFPEAKLYKDLRDMEQTLDATISRKKFDVEDTLARGAQERKKLRIYVSNTAVDQPWQTVDRIDQNAFDFDIGTIPSWILRIEGKLLDDDTPQDSPSYRKLTSFFHSITVELDRPKELYPDGNVIVWNQQPVLDVLEVKRKGDTDVSTKVSFYLATSPERYKLSPALSSVLGDQKEESRQGAVVGLWYYIKLNNLQDSDDKRIINCDDKLKELFNGQEKIPFSQMIDQLGPHLLSLDPIVIEYTIRVDKEQSHAEFVYDIEVDVDSPQKKQLEDVLVNWYNNQDEINSVDDHIGLTIQELSTSKLRRDFFTQMSHDPANFINKWIASQARDLEVVLGDRELQSEEVRRAGFYMSEDLKESIFLLLNKR
ncbi:hypothetical protein V1511DRAFT_505781 [Dipodascopsis uninucleata]